jgi:anhydro-N-acetylmuramic acid kinase
VAQGDAILAVGAISGTSMDGIDVALVETDGEGVARPGAGATYPYPPDLRAQLQAVIADPARAEHDPLDEIEAAVTDAHCDAVLRLLAENGVDPQRVALAGLHGQTVFHRPERRFTRQLLDGARAARRLGIDVVNRFRHADVAAGGEGAPLVPLYHQALAQGLERPLMVLNWGGVGNVTFLGEGDPVAFDTGPANALIDDWVSRRLGRAYDADGAVAAAGRADAAMGAALMDNPFFDRPAPKSLDRNDFHRRARIVERLGVEDGAATLAAFTVEATAAALRHVPAAPARWLVTGGGRLNATLMRRLGERLGVTVEPVEAVGWDGDYLEAQCFAYLAARSRRGLPLSLPSTTGVPAPATGGDVHPAPRAGVA